MLKPPMVGRDDALRSLSKCMEDALGEKGRVVFVSGEAGIGKTRLAEEFESLAKRKGFQVMVGWCIPGAPTPYLPFLEAFTRAPKEGGGNQRAGKILETLRKSAPDIAGATPVIGGYLRASATIYKEYSQPSVKTKDESESFLFSSLDYLRKLSAVTPVLIRIEDLQWGDTSTIQLMHFLARNVTALRVLIIGTFRSEEVEGEEGGEVHPLMESLRVMKREGVCHELSLKPLNQKDMGEAISYMLGGPLEPALLRRMASESGGNPLFFSEIVRLLVDRGAIEKENGVWVAKEGVTLDIPDTLSEVALRRLERLSLDEKRLLECAAVEGQYFHLRTLQDVLGADSMRLLEDLDSLERDHQLLQSFEDYFMFNHELICRVIYDRIATPRRKELHRLVGLALEKVKTGPSNYGTLSLHFFKAGAAEKCAEYSLLAGKDCLWEFSMLEAVIYFQRALECSPSGEACQVGRLQALEGLGDAFASEELVKAAKALTYYEECLAEADSPKVRARLLRKMSWCWRPDELGKGDSTRARELLREAESCQDLDPSERAEIYYFKMRVSHFDGEWEEAEGYATKAEELFEGLEAHERLAMMLVEHATVDLCRGLVNRAFEKLERASAINSKHPSIGAESFIALSYPIANMHRGEYVKALKCFDRVLEMLDKRGDYGGMQGMLYYRTLLFDIIGDFESELAEMLKGFEMAEITGSEYFRLASCVLAIHSYIRLKMIDEALAKGTELKGLMGQFNFRMRSLNRSLAEIVQAELCFANGDWEEGNRRFQNGILEIRKGQYGAYFEGVSRSWYGDYLAQQSRDEDARLQYGRALEIFKRLENGTEAERVMRKLSSIS